MQYWMSCVAQITLAEQRREEDLARFEHLRRHNLLALPERSGLRATLAAWLLRAALRLDAHIGAGFTIQGSRFQAAASR